MPPRLPELNAADGRLGNAVPLRKLLKGLSGLCAYCAHLACGQLCAVVVFAACQGLWMQAGPVSVTSGEAFWMKSSVVLVAAFDQFWVRLGGVAVASGHALGMKMRPALVSALDLFRMTSSPMLVSSRPLRPAFGIRLGRMTALPHHISMIVGIGSEKQVIGIDARTVVAFMKNVETFGYRAFVDAPREAVGPLGLSADVQFAITASYARPHPQVTRTKLRTVRRNRTVLVDVRPEAFDDSLVHGLPPLGHVPGRVAATRALPVCTTTIGA